MQKLWGSFIDGRGAAGLLILRVVFGAGLMMHGWPKIQAPFAWMKSNDVPGFVQAFAALGEFGGGLALALGFLTPLGCLGIACTMAGAWWFSHSKDPWINPGGRSFELASLYGTVALAMLFAGPGRFSVDALLFGGKKK